MQRAVLIVAILVVVAACSGSGGTGSATPQHPVITVPLTTNATLRIVVPSAAAQSGSTARRPAFVSSGTQSIGVVVQTVNGIAPSPPPTPTIVALTPTSPGCTGAPNATTCTANITVPVASAVVLAISSYASTDGTGAAIATGLTSATNTTQSGASFAVALGGVPATFAFSPTTLQANQDGTTQTFTFTVRRSGCNRRYDHSTRCVCYADCAERERRSERRPRLSPNSIASPASSPAAITVTYTSSTFAPGCSNDQRNSRKCHLDT